MVVGPVVVSPPPPTPIPHPHPLARSAAKMPGHRSAAELAVMHEPPHTVAEVEAAFRDTNTAREAARERNVHHVPFWWSAQENAREKEAFAPPPVARVDAEAAEASTVAAAEHAAAPQGQKGRGPAARSRPKPRGKGPRAATTSARVRQDLAGSRRSHYFGYRPPSAGAHHGGFARCRRTALLDPNAMKPPGR